ncbi:MAG: T9SS type A sorting domain-containing protein [Crocinitomicaceae bacterium]|nr:T9SS type A sorting domain-containing protein [Crocinitomicaceae bacterium]
MLKSVWITFGLFLFLSFHLFGQVDVFSYVKELSSYQTPPHYSIQDGQKYNHETYWSHPDFGKLTFAAPIGKNVVEDISKRKIDERYYVDLDEPTFFYIEKSNIPINYLKDGSWRAIDYSLYPTSNGYAAVNQPYPTFLDLNNSCNRLKTEKGILTFNKFRLSITHFDESVEILDPNWSNISINNFEAYIHDIFPGIDQRISFVQSGIKSDFIIKHNLNVKSISFIDHLETDENLAIKIEPYGPYQFDYVQVYDTITNELMALGHPAYSRADYGNAIGWIAEYELNNGVLSINCDSTMLNDPSHIYPIVVDPLFTAVASTAGGFVGSDGAPTTCTGNINVTYPGGSTPWDVSITWNVRALFCGEIYVFYGGLIDPCFMSNAQLWFTSSCGGISPSTAPTTIWTCSSAIPACNAQGNWNPTLAFGADPSTQSLVQCYTPSCSNQTLTFTSHLNRNYCGSFYNGIDDCTATLANSPCIALTAWSVTVQGKSVESLGNTVTGNGSQLIYDVDCAGSQLLNPTPLYGVPGYTYSWSPGGATSSTLSVPGTISTYTCDVTDACGTTVTATFNIDCPLSAEELTLSGDKLDDKIRLQWTSYSNNPIDHFEIERQSDMDHWVNLGSIEANGNQETAESYQFYDEEPGIGVNVYRVVQHLENETIGHSESISVVFREEFSVFPNPASDHLTIDVPGVILEGTEILISDPVGKIIMRFPIMENSTTVDISKIQQGNYYVRMIRSGELRAVKQLTIR